jgi:hypothetical protein
LRKSVETNLKGHACEERARRGSATNTRTFKGEIVKRKYARILLSLIGVLGIGTAAKAQIRGEIKVTLPFEFVVDGETLPAGTYTVSRFADVADKPEVSFQRLGEQLFLSSIRIEHDVYSIAVPRSTALEAAGRSHENTGSPDSSGNN